MTETAIKSKIGEGDGRKVTFFVQKMMNLQKVAISQWFGKNLCGLGRGAEEFLGKW